MPISAKYLRYQTACIAASLLLMNGVPAFADPVHLSLEDSVRLALANNPSIHIAAADKNKAAASVDAAKAGKLPSLSLSSSYNLADSSPGTSNSSDLSNGLRLSWPLYSGGRTEGQIKQSELGMTTADLNVEETKQQLKLDATTAYFNLLEARNMVTVNQETVDNLTQHLNIVQANYDAGVVAKSDVLRAEVEQANAKQNLLKAQNDYALAQTSLLNTLNLDPNTEVQLDGDLSYAPDARTLEDCIAQAKQDRPDIAQANAAIDSAKIGVKLAQSGKLPTVSLSASDGWNDSFLPKSDNWSVGLSASWNLYDAGSTNAQVKEAQASVDKAQLQAEQTADSVDQEVRQSYLSMKEAEKRLESTKVTVDKANEDTVIAQEKYKAGVGTNLDVIDAQLALTQAKTNHVQALYDYNVNQAKLDKAIGVKVE